MIEMVPLTCSWMGRLLPLAFVPPGGLEEEEEEEEEDVSVLV